MNLPASNESSATARLSLARLKQWHQQGEALLTMENARSFLNSAGLVLFAPRPQIAAPAPSFVEAVLGEANATPTVAQTAPARELLARLVAEGLAVPLNLLGIASVIGQAGDLPDFVVSAQVFSYVFTLRGDKGWKQPPQATGVEKFSNLAIAAHEALSRRGPLSAYDLATELGKEVTEAAVLRSLGELWSHLRVLPVPQVDGGATLWELAGTRLNKQIKAGANAGLPTALSALISLYLGQAIVASEDEVESFLSPLAARSRVRDVLHALLSARQLDAVAVEGRTMLHVAGAVPAFLAEVEPEINEAVDVPAGSDAAEAAAPAVAAEEEHGEITPVEPGSRIAKFAPRGKPAGKDLAKAKPAKFARKPVSPRSDEARPRFVRPERLDGKPERERRPFVKREGSDSRPPRKPFERSAGERGPRKFADRSSESRPPRKPFDRSSDSRPPRKAFDRGGDRPVARKPYSRSAEDRPARKPFDRSSDSRPPRKPFDRGGDRPTGRKPFGKPDRFAPKREFASGEDRPKREFKPRSFEGRKSFGGPKPFGKPRPFAARKGSGDGREEKGARGFGGKRPFSKPGGFSKPFRSRETGEGARPDRAGFGGKRFGAGRPGGAKPGGPGGRFGEKKFSARPGGAKFGSKSGGAKLGPGKFGAKKFGGKKPFGKPKGPRGERPSQEDSEA